jgi:hypothetical protein
MRYVSVRLIEVENWLKGGFPSPRTKLLAARCECLHLIKIDCLALRLDESAHACTRSEELRARTGNPP